MVIYSLGPRIAVLLALGLVVAAILMPSLRLTLIAVMVVNIAAVVRAPILGITPASLAGPGRAFVLGLFAMQIGRQLSLHTVPVVRATAHLAPLAAVIGLSLLAAPQFPKDAQNAAPFVGLIAGLAIAAAILCRSEEGLRTAIVVVAVSYGGLVLLQVVLLPFVGQTVFIEAAEGARFRGILENPNSVGLTIFPAIASLLGLAVLSRPRSIVRRACVGLAAIAMTELFVSVSRGGIAAGCAALVVMFVALSRDRLSTRAIAGVFASGVVIIVLAFGLGGSLFQALRLASAGEAGGRRAVAVKVRESVLDRPILGYGYGSEETIIGSYGPVAFVGGHAGNIVASTALELGLLGLLALGLALLVPFLRVARLNKRNLSRTELVARAVFLAILIGGVTAAQSESYSLVPGSTSVAVLWFAAGICASFSRRERARVRESADIVASRETGPEAQSDARTLPS